MLCSFQPLPNLGSSISDICLLNCSIPTGAEICFQNFFDIMCFQVIPIVQQPEERSLGGMQLKSWWTVTGGKLFWSAMGPPICSADLLEFLR